MEKTPDTHLCRRCGRKLRSEQSKQRGMGTTCYLKWNAEHRCKKLVTVKSPSLQIDEKVI